MGRDLRALETDVRNGSAPAAPSARDGSAIRGPIIPLPLQTPAIVILWRPILTRAAADLRLVSVVTMALAKRIACSGLSPSAAAAARMPRCTLGIGSRCPM